MGPFTVAPVATRYVPVRLYDAGWLSCKTKQFEFASDDHIAYIRNCLEQTRYGLHELDAPAVWVEHQRKWRLFVAWVEYFCD